MLVQLHFMLAKMKQQSREAYSDQRRHLFYDEPKPFHNNMLQIIKIFDGFFMGNEYAGKYSQFISNNKISLIINTAPQDIKLDSIRHVEIMDYDFYDTEGHILQKLNMNLLLDIIAKLDAHLQLKCQGAVVVSKNIDSRVLSIAILYFMIKYSWDFSYTFQFLQSNNDTLNLNNQFISLLNQFNRNTDRFKLSQAFATDQTEHEEIILKNTFTNSIVINFPNFYGLDCSKPQKPEQQVNKDQGMHLKRKKVKFLQNGQQIIDRRSNKYENPINLTSKQSRVADMQRKLKLYIKQKSYLKQQNNGIHKVSRHNDSQNDIILIKNKELSKKMITKRRVASRTQQSAKQQSQVYKYNNYFDIKTEDSHQNAKQFTESPHQVKVKSRLESISFMEQKNKETDTFRKASDRMYVIHNNKKPKMTKRCITEEPNSSEMMSYSIENPKEQLEHQKLNQIFKISKSNKSSSKKIKVHSNSDNTRKLNPNSNLTKVSQKLIKMSEYEDISRYWVQNAQKKTQKEKDKSIINVHFNLKIQNFNVNADRTQRGVEQYRRNNYRVFHSKKLSKRLVQ